MDTRSAVKPLAAFAIAIMVSMTGCTAGFITKADGSQWTPASDGSKLQSAVVTFSNSSNAYQVWTRPTSVATEFSYDLYASPKYTGNYLTNRHLEIPAGTYTVSVGANHLWQASNVKVDDRQTCPYSDAYTGASPIDCQLFQLDLLGCNQAPKAPYKSGNVTVVQLAQKNSGQCGTQVCKNHVVDYAGAYFTDPAVTEVYVGCNASSPAGCKMAPNTGLWAKMSSSNQFWSEMVEYGAGVGSYHGAYKLTQLAVPQVVSDDVIASDLLTAIKNKWVKSPYTYLDMQHPAVFVVYLPSTGCAGSCTGGSHHFPFLGPDGQLYNVALIRGYANADLQDEVATHEMEEAVTDPKRGKLRCGVNTGCGWNEPGVNQSEISDLCGGYDVIDGFHVARLWSQDRCGCL